MSMDDISHRKVTILDHIRSVIALPFMVVILIPFFLNRNYTESISGFLNISSTRLLIIGIILMIPGIYLFIQSNILFHKIGNGTLAPWTPTQKLVVKNLYQQITKWWISGKLSDDDYILAIKYFAHIPSSPSIEIPYYPPLEIQDGFAIPIFSFEKEAENKETMVHSQELQQQLKIIDYLIPFEKHNTIKQQGKFPDWFKDRAILWIDDEVGDFIFLDGLEGLLRSKNIVP